MHQPASELEQAMENICSMEDSFPAEGTESKQAKAAENKVKAVEMQKKAMESFSETKARTASDEALAEPKKKKRRGGNESIDFLKEKSEQELEVRKAELKFKEKEQERLFEQQRGMMQLMQSQQQSMVELFGKLVNKLDK